MIGDTCSRPNRIGAVTRSSPRGAVPSPTAAFDLVEIGEHAPRARQEPLAGLGDADRTGGAVEQPYPEPRFELADRARDRGRRAASRRAASAKLRRSATSTNTATLPIRSILFLLSQ